MTGNDLRQAFLDFFEKKEHLILPSAPLVPENDPSLLWINAGMAPFKPYFDGREKAAKNRIASSQKCIRTNDIENVGKTARHQTFFEMLGNFSFGDYFKEDAIEWAWEFVTEVLNFSEDRLWITIYKDDDEAFDIWHEQVGVSKERIVRMGKKDNFWQIGTGPCGPCSEIHYDRGEEYSNSSEDVLGGEGDRYLEIWNLVFTQYNYTEDGEYLTLPNKNIDTGMGLERIASILQGVDSNYETDLLKPIIDYVENNRNISYSNSDDIRMAYRVIADHSRAITMAIFDGALPSNEGRGYVIRRLLRRAVRYGRELGYKDPFLYDIVPVVIEMMSDGYPELKQKSDHIKTVIKSEEERFLKTLDQGINILNDMMNNMEDKDIHTLNGQKAFKLYDTYGFPLDLTKDVLEENDFEIDEDGFEMEMEKQRHRAREARENIGFSGPEEDIIYSEIKNELGCETEFIGYDVLEGNSKILSIIKEGKTTNNLKEGETGEIILDNTPFYAESGGQIGDRGLLENNNNKAEIIDTYKKSGLFVHKVNVIKGNFNIEDNTKAIVYSNRRAATASNHSSTHLLHQALRDILGEHVSQSGSLVSEKRLRFDFSHYSALSEEELIEVEKIVNRKIIENLPVRSYISSLDKAREMGAAALFSEKYGEEVRVIKMGDYSLELCGGTHVKRTGDIGLFKIISESGIAAGVRRIEALTGIEALNYINSREEILKNSAAEFNANPDELIEKIKIQENKQKELLRKIDSLKNKLANSKSDELLEKLEKIAGINVLTAKLDGLDNDSLRNMADEVLNNIDSGLIVLASHINDKVIFVSMITDDLVQKGYHAGKIIGKVARITGGGGGGRPDMAQAGGKKAELIDKALAEVKKIVFEPN